MKNTALLILILTCGCTADNVTPTGAIDDPFDTTQATLIKKGTMMGIGHTVSGVAAVYQQGANLVVLLEPYSSQSGPDLKVYLSKDANASEYIRLGNLKSTSGKQSYAVPGTPDISQYNFVHIWCEQYTVVFGQAEIK